MAFAKRLKCERKERHRRKTQLLRVFIKHIRLFQTLKLFKSLQLVIENNLIIAW